MNPPINSGKTEEGWLLKTILPAAQLKSSLEFRMNGQSILLLNYGSRLELFTSLYNAGNKTVSIEPQLSIPLPGPIEHMRWLGENRVLVINTKSQFQVLALSPQGISVLLRGTLEDGVRRPMKRGSLVCIDPLCRFFIYTSAQGIMRFVPLVYRGADVYLGSVHNVRLNELNVVDMALTWHPQYSEMVILHVLYQEGASQYALSRYWIDWSSPVVFVPDRHIMPQHRKAVISMRDAQKIVVMPNFMDILVFAADGVSFFTPDDKCLSVRTALINYTAFKPISERLVVCGDVDGRLFLLQRIDETAIRLQLLGQAEPCVCLEYLGEAMVWCGGASGFGSNVVNFTAEPNARGEYLKAMYPWGSESCQLVDACVQANDSLLAVSTSRAPYPPSSSVWMVKDGYGCSLTDAVELETGGAQVTKLFHVTMDNGRFFVVGDSAGTRVVLDYQQGCQPASQVETSSLELLKGARGLRKSNRGEFYSFSERSVFLVAPRMELVYKATSPGNPIKNVDVYEDVCVVHGQNDLVVGPFGWAWRHVLPIKEEIATLALGRSGDGYVLAVVDWDRTLRVYAFDSVRIEVRLERKMKECIAPRDVCLLGGEFVLVGDARGQVFAYNYRHQQNGAHDEGTMIKIGTGAIKFEPFLDRVVIVGGRPSVVSVVHGGVQVTPLNLPPLSACVDMGMGGFAAVTTGSNVLISGSIDVDNPFGKQVTKVLLAFLLFCRSLWMSIVKRRALSGVWWLWPCMAWRVI